MNPYLNVVHVQQKTHFCEITRNFWNASLYFQLRWCLSLGWYEMKKIIMKNKQKCSKWETQNLEIRHATIKSKALRLLLFTYMLWDKNQPNFKGVCSLRAKQLYLQCLSTGKWASLAVSPLKYLKLPVPGCAQNLLAPPMSPLQSRAYRSLTHTSAALPNAEVSALLLSHRRGSS